MLGHPDRREQRELGAEPSRPRPPRSGGRAARATLGQRQRARAPAPGPAGRCRAGRRRAVAAMSTRLSGSSTQSTGTSWIRSPARSASTSSSVSKNQPCRPAPAAAARGATSAPDRLEAALRVGEAGPQRAAQQQVVAARDQLPLRPADDPRPAGQPGADREVGVARRSAAPPAAAARRGRSRGRRPCRRAPAPSRPTRPPAAPGRGPSPAGARPHLGVLVGERGARPRGGVGAGVVGDRDPERVREARRRWAWSRRTERPGRSPRCGPGPPRRGRGRRARRPASRAGRSIGRAHCTPSGEVVDGDAVDGRAR